MQESLQQTQKRTNSIMNNDINRIVKALDLAIKQSTYYVPESTKLFGKPEQIKQIDGNTLEAAIQTIINLYGLTEDTCTGFIEQ